MSSTATKREMEKQAAELAADEVCITTNTGTYSSHEACDAIGTGDPAFADYWVYERIGDGRKRVVGCDPKEAPGSPRPVNRAELARKRSELQKLRKAISSAR